MLPFLSVVIGLALIIGSLYWMRRDIEVGNIRLTKGLDGVSDRNLERLVKYLDDLEKSMEDMNQAFYELVSDLEGELALNRKEISELEVRLSMLEKGHKPIISGEKAFIQNSQVQSLTEMVSKEPSPVNRTEFLPVDKSENQTEVSVAIDLSLKPMAQLTDLEIRSVKARIVQLKKNGLNMNQIAKDLNIGVGELQLFIKLNTR